MLGFRAILAAGSIFLAAAGADAASISYGVTPPGPAISTGLLGTNFSTTVSVPKFNTALGVLNSITFTLGGTVSATLRFESRNSGPTTLNGLGRATVTLTRPDATTLVFVTPQQAAVRNASAYDGVIDFGGTSGFTITGVFGAASKTSGFLTSSTDLALFSAAGGGAILLPVKGTGTSNVTGASNVASSFTTQASAEVSVVYVYTEAPPPPVVSIPEPATLALMGCALLGLGLIRRHQG